MLGVSTDLPAAPLSVFVAKLPVVWANRMREKVLEGARSQLVDGDYHNSVDSEGFFTAEPDTPLHFPPCQVTASCADLLRAAHSTLEAACNCTQTDSLPASTLFRTARELLDLFRAVRECCLTCKKGKKTDFFFSSKNNVPGGTPASLRSSRLASSPRRPLPQRLSLPESRLLDIGPPLSLTPTYTTQQISHLR